MGVSEEAYEPTHGQCVSFQLSRHLKIRRKPCAPVGATGPDTGTGTPSTGTPSTGTTTIAAGPEVDALLNRLEQLADRLEGKN